MRVLITGSRGWADKDAIWNKLDQLDKHDLVIVHGRCPWGADQIANDWARKNNVAIEPHAALWNKFGRAAGHIRNKEMVDSGADVCYAFLLDDSPGTLGCIKLAESAGIPTEIDKRSSADI